MEQTWPLLLTLQEALTTAGRLPESETCFKGSQTKEACVLRATLNYITLACTCREKR